MKAIILAAGNGSRLRPETETRPKPLLPVGKKLILERMIEAVIASQITEIAIVTGYLGKQVHEFVTNRFPQLQVTFIANNDFRTTNTAYSLLLTRDFAHGSDFVKFDADVVFEPAVLEKVLSDTHKNCLCIDRNIRLEQEEVKVITNGNSQVLSVGKKLNPHEAAGESIGIEKISAATGEALFTELEQLMHDQANYQNYYDDSYTTMVEKGFPFAAVDITGLKWVEIDNHDDLHRAQELFSEPETLIMANA